jgi:hypothetical protein
MMPTLAEHWDVADKHDRVCLILPEQGEEDAKTRAIVIAAVLEVTDDKIVLGDHSETEFFTTSFSWKGEPLDEGRLKAKRIPASELERLEECRIQGLYPPGRLPATKYAPRPR